MNSKDHKTFLKAADAFDKKVCRSKKSARAFLAKLGIAETIQCDDCDNHPTYIRHTQFAGNHSFCTPHAKAEKNFGVSDSYQFWEKLKTKKIKKKP